MLTRFDPSDIITTKLDTANTQFTVSTSAVAAASSIWVFVANSTTGGFLPKPDSSSLSASNIPISSAFRHISNYFFGRSTNILDSYDNSTTRTTIRAIQVGRPTLDEGIYQGTVTAVLSAVNFCISAIDQQNTASIVSPLGLTGSMVNKQNTAEKVGTIFYDHGVIVFHGGIGATGNIICNSSSGLSFAATVGGTDTATAFVNLVSFKAQSRNIVKRTIYFTTAKNGEFNYTTNPTARNSDGTLISSLTANPTTYITTIGLYDDNDQLLAIAKVVPPRKKNQYEMQTFKIQLDF